MKGIKLDWMTKGVIFGLLPLICYLLAPKTTVFVLSLLVVAAVLAGVVWLLFKLADYANGIGAQFTFNVAFPACLVTIVSSVIFYIYLVVATSGMLITGHTARNALYVQKYIELYEWYHEKPCPMQTKTE